MTEKNPAAQALRAIPSDKRAQASRENGKKGGAPLKPLESIACTCGTLTEQHKSTCRRRMTEYQRNRRKNISS